MGSLGGQLWQWGAVLVAAVLVAVGAILAPAALKARILKYRWWFVGLGVLGLAWIFLVVLPAKVPPAEFGPSALPGPFRQGYWTWMLAFLLGAGGAVVAAMIQLRRSGRAETAVAEPADFPAIDAAWDEIRIRLGQARIDPTGQRVYLLLAPAEEPAADFIESAGLQLFAQGPAGSAPIHAYATADGVFLSVAGACNLGAPGDPEATARLEHVARRLLALRVDAPVVRSVTVLLPIDWCASPESVKQATAVREDILTLRRVLGLHAPTFAVFCGMEAVAGFATFADRLATQVSPQMLDQRVGFAVPSSHTFAGELIQRGLTWQSAWFRRWLLHLLAGDPTDHRGNAELFLLDSEFRRYRKRLRAVLESAFSTHQESEPILFRGCYFVATGSRRAGRAFATGLLRGPRSRLVADHVAADWTDEALRADRVFGRWTLGIGLVGGLLCLAVWLYIAGRSPGLGWSGLAALALSWVVAIVLLLRR